MVSWIALQIVVALSFVLRFILAEQWPLLGSEAETARLVLGEVEYWSEAETLRWSSLAGVSVFMMFWGVYMKQKTGVFPLLAVVLFHLFPDFIALGVMASYWSWLPVFIVFLLWLQSKADDKRGDISSQSHLLWGRCHSWLPVLLLLPLMLLNPYCLLLLPPFTIFLLEKFNLKWGSANINMMLTVLAVIFAVTFGHQHCMEKGWDSGFNWGTEPMLALLLLCIGTWVCGFKSEFEQENNWYWGWMPIIAVAIGGVELPLVLWVIALMYLFSGAHLRWWSRLNTPSQCSLVLVLLLFVYQPSSSAMQSLTESWKISSNREMLAREAQSLVQGQQLVLCSDPELASLLRFSLQPSTVLVFPTDEVNRSYSEVGKPGVWIHDSESGAPPLNLESCRPWKQLEHLGDKRRILIERFDRLLYPF